ncbi:MAG: hypothetical protein K9L17_07005 [Clostridiales bacterium]|nr:hypothetical protein [Clostridiales bacterium]MCF8022420.1 hypothetical protein [Clostridiales bacterium]
MHIHNIFPILLRLLQSETVKQQNTTPSQNTQQLNSPQNHAQQRPTSTVEQQSRTNAQQSKTGTSTHIDTHGSTSTTLKGNPSEANNHLLFIPLPLKSEIFPDAKFYKQVATREEQQQDGQTEQNRLVFGIRAPSAGEIYFLIIQKDNYLSLKCAASKTETVQEIKNSFDNLKKSLAQQGWEDISLSCLHVDNPAVLPGMTPSGFIDLKI